MSGERPELQFHMPHEALAFAQERLGRDFLGEARGYQGIAITRRGKMVGAAIFHSMQANRGSVEVSFAGMGAFLTREIVQALYVNAFELLGCAHMTCRTSARNRRAIRALTAIGFSVEGRQKNAWDGEFDAVLLGATPETARRFKEGKE